MRNKFKNIILMLIGYCIPFSFLGMYGDATFDSMWLYALAVIGYGFLCWLCIQYRSLTGLLLGNVLSCGISVVCVELFQTEEWAWYFKPFTAVKMVLVISVVAFIIQIAIWLFTKNRTKSTQNQSN